MAQLGKYDYNWNILSRFSLHGSESWDEYSNSFFLSRFH